MSPTSHLVAVVAVACSVAAIPAGASASLALAGSFSTTVTKPAYAGPCPAGVADECGRIELAGLGTAEWAYTYGPAFDPDGSCFDVDGTLALTLLSDGSSVSGPLTGVFCPRQPDTAHQHRSSASWGNPYAEHDSILFTSGTGRFDGLTGSATFDRSAAGAHYVGTLSGSLG